MFEKVLSRWIRSHLYSQNNVVANWEKKSSATDCALLSVLRGWQTNDQGINQYVMSKVNRHSEQYTKVCLLLIPSTTTEIIPPRLGFDSPPWITFWGSLSTHLCHVWVYCWSTFCFLKDQFGPNTLQCSLCLTPQYLGKRCQSSWPRGKKDLDILMLVTIKHIISNSII